MVSADAPVTALIRPVILCGGAGTRLWPESRRERPKQFLHLAGDRSMLEATLDRVADPSRFAAPILLSDQKLEGSLKELFQEAGVPEPIMQFEPTARNTGPAIALAALARPADELLLFLPSDHLICDPGAFLTAVDRARQIAEAGYIVTFGITPTRPETGFGYIKLGEQMGQGLHRVGRFTEKPDFATAASWCADRRHVWNAGIFFGRGGSFAAALALHAPAIFDPVQRFLASSCQDTAAFAEAPPLPFDRAVMEKGVDTAVVATEMGWSDVGSWDAVWEEGQADAAGNVVSGEVTTIDASNCLLRSDGVRIVAIGVRDLVAIASGDTVLIVPRGLTQRVSEVQERLNKPSD